MPFFKKLFRASGWAGILCAPIFVAGCLATSPLSFQESDKDLDGIWDSVAWELAEDKTLKKFDPRAVRLMAIHYQLKLRHPKYMEAVELGAPSMYSRATACIEHLYGDTANTVRRQILKRVTDIYFGPAETKLVSPRQTWLRQQHAKVDVKWQKFQVTPYPVGEEACEDSYRGYSTFNAYNTPFNLFKGQK